MSDTFEYEWPPDIDVEYDPARWKGGPKPADQPPGGCPHGFVVVHRSAYPEDAELQRWVLEDCAGLSELAQEHAEATVRVPGSTIVLYDGDTGHPVIRLGLMAMPEVFDGR